MYLNRKKNTSKCESVTRSLIVAFMLSLWIPALAQETKVVQDLRLWTGVAVEKTFAKDWTVSLAQEFRFKHDISEISNYFTEAGLNYRINKNFELEAQYRLTWDRKRDLSYEKFSRYSLDLRYKGMLDFISIRYRLRYQKEVPGMNLFDQTLPYEKYVRNRLTIRYEDIKELKPYVSAELFQLFEPGAVPEFHYYRVMGGVRYRPGKIGDFKIGFGFNRQVNSGQPATIYVINVNYTYSF